MVLTTGLFGAQPQIIDVGSRVLPLILPKLPPEVQDNLRKVQGLTVIIHQTLLFYSAMSFEYPFNKP